MVRKEETGIQQDWEAVIGLEIHVELNTRSKLFSTALNHFGSEPNSNISEVCTGQPGALPVVNMEAVKKAVQFGLAVEADIALFSQFDRKSYFYPDSPRNFQITQYQFPIVQGGSITAVVGGEEKTFLINRAHLEDDAGMLKHFSTFAGIDYNRAGVPLIEIVSEPCIKSAQEASAYAMAIKAVMEYLDASDCNMEEGSLRMDVNISVRKKGETGLRNKIEIKNMNSFSNMEIAIQAEIAHQIKKYTDNPNENPKEIVPQATYRWDPERKEIVLMRRKEDAEDYLYFPEPDLPPLILTPSYVEDIRKTLPELPLQKEKRYVDKLALSKLQASYLAGNKKIADYFELCLNQCSHPKALANWIMVEFPGRLKEKGLSLPQTAILPLHIATLVNLIDSGEINGKIAKVIADEMVAQPGIDPQEIILANPALRPINDKQTVEEWVNQTVLAHPQSIQDYCAGRDKAFAFLVGQVMKLSQGKASPSLVNELLIAKIKETNAKR